MFYTFRYSLKIFFENLKNQPQKGVLDAARRSDRSGEWESVDVGDEYDSSLKFQHEMSLYCEVIDQLQI